MGILDTVTDFLGGETGEEDAWRASETSAKAAEEAARIQYQQYLTSREDLAPYRYGGTAAFNMLSATMGITPLGYKNTAMEQYTDKQWRYIMNQAQERSDRETRSAKFQINPNTGKQYTDDEWNYVVRYHQLRGEDVPLGQNWAEVGGEGKAGKQPFGNIPTDPSAGPPGDPNMGFFEASPGYQFRQDEARKATERSAAARGRQLSGATLKSLTEYSQGIASQEFGNWWNQLGGLAGIGQTTTTTTADLGETAASNVARGVQTAGDARASGYMASANYADAQRASNLELWGMGANAAMGGMSGSGQGLTTNPNADFWGSNAQWDWNA